MKEKIIAFLKTKLLGVPDNYILGVAEHFSKTVTEEKQIETTFTDGVIDLLKLNADLLQSEGDKRVTEATKTALKNFQEKHGLKEDGTPIKKVGRPSKKKDDDPDDSDDSDEPDEKMPAWAKKILAKNSELEQKIMTQEKSKTQEVLSLKVKNLLKEKKVDEDWLVGRNLIPNSEAEIDQLVSQTVGDYNTYTQKMAEKGVVISVPPAGGGTAGDKVTIDDYLNDKFPDRSKSKN